MNRLPTLIELDRELGTAFTGRVLQDGVERSRTRHTDQVGMALDAMCEHLEAVHSGQIKRLLMNVPPGMMKSLLTGVFLPRMGMGRGRLAVPALPHDGA